jgi:pimeloyl-ACP methyl ester carboxylesterase
MAAGELSRLETSCRPWRRAVRSSNSKDTADVADRPFSFEQSADDTAALLQHLKIDRADFFGFSNGGDIALQIAIRHPKRVRKLVVASAMFKGDGLYPEVWQFMKRATLQNMPQELQEAYRKAAPHPQRHFNPQQMVELTSAIAWENYRARFDHAFGIEAEGFSAGTVCALPAGGPQDAGSGHA